MIIIPIQWLFHWEYTLFSDEPISPNSEKPHGLGHGDYGIVRESHITFSQTARSVDQDAMAHPMAHPMAVDGDPNS